MFYFTAFYGKKESLLYYFYLSVYKVFLGDPNTAEMKVAVPLNIIRNKKISTLIHDFIAPFYTYIHVWYSLKSEDSADPLNAGILILKSQIEVSVFGKTITESESTITLKENCIMEFTYQTNKTKIQAKWANS